MLLFYYRRLQYGNFTQVNVTVQLQDDNKAILLVALEKSDRPFYACDGGCLDGPVLLGLVFTLHTSHFQTSISLIYICLCLEELYI